MKRLSKGACGIIALVTVVITMVVDILILCKLLPFNLVMGGRIQSYDQAIKMMIPMLVILGMLGTCIAISADIIVCHKLKKLSNGVLMFFIVYFCINVILNLLGKTWFEKVVANLLTIIQISCCAYILKTNRREYTKK